MVTKPYIKMSKCFNCDHMPIQNVSNVNDKVSQVNKYNVTVWEWHINCITCLFDH